LCTYDPKEKAYLHMLFNYSSTLGMTLLYRGSRDGWTQAYFHSLCDGKSPTISLFKVKNGPCIGGYTEAKWNSKRGYVNDCSAFLFSLTAQIRFPVKDQK
jgi:hypothetical protein